MPKKRVRLGIEAENMGRAAMEPGIVAMAQAIEFSGADSISVSDHLLSIDPGNSAEAEPWLEALSCLAAIAAVTTRPKLIASVIILPQRNVLELLKTITTIDVLSGNRLVLGVGSGWNRQEMEALGYDFDSRGERMNEMLSVIRGLHGTSVAPFDGQQIAVPEGVRMSPANLTPPIYIGGSGVSTVSLRRTLAFGDGWMPYSMAGGYDGAALRQTLHFLREERQRAGEQPFDTIFKLGVDGHASELLVPSVRELAGIGFDEIIVQGIFEAGLDAGIAIIHHIRDALDS